MKIADLAVDRFGVWHQVRLDNLGPGLTVFYGPNEAGKTTLMQFVRSVLHGFSAERRARYLPPMAGYPAGGSLTLTDGEYRYLLQREIDRDGYESELRIETDGDAASAARLRERLSAVDEAVFNNVFVLGLQDLQRLGTLTDTRAGQFLFRIASGVDRVSLYDVMNDLAESRDRMLSAEDRPCEVVHLAAQTARLRSEVKELAAASGQYGELVAQLREVTTDLRQVRSARQTAHDALERIRLAQSLLPAWQRRATLDQQIADLGEVADVSREALEQIEQIDARRSKLRRVWSRLRGKRSMLLARAKAMQVNEDLWQQAARIEALCDQREWIASLESQLDAVRQEVEGLSARLAAERRRIGIHTDDQGRPVGRKQLAALRRLAIELRDARRQLKQLEDRGQQHHEALAALDQQVAGGLAGRADSSLTDALERQGAIVNQLRHRLELDDRAEQLARQLKDLEAQRLELLERQVIPGWVIGTVGGFFAMGICLLLAGLVLPLPMSGTFSLALAAMGGLGALGAGGAKYLIEQSNHRKLDRCEKQLSVLALQIKQNKEERTEIDAQLPRGAGPLTVRLQAAEHEMAQLEELIPLNARRESLARDRQSQQHAREELHGEIEARRSAWQQALADAGLPPDCSPTQVKSLRQSNTQIERLREQLAMRRQELDQRQQAIDQFAERVSPLLSTAGIAPEARRLSDLLAQLGTALLSIRSQAEQRNAARSEYRQSGRRDRKLRRTLKSLQARRSALLRESGVEHEEELRRAQARRDRYNELCQGRQEAQTEIDSLLADRLGESELADWIELVAQPELCESRLTEHTATRTNCDQRADDLARQQGELNERIKVLVADRQIPNKQIDVAASQQRLNQALERWQVLALSWSILDKLRRSYEHERQPETLRVASQYFRRLTGDRYLRVWTPLGETTLLVNDHRGHSLPVEVLSRGTREQLFLALRLALTESYAKRGIELPLVLDDLLVNFDQQRVRAAALVLRDFAEAGHQVLMFTCHEHLMRLFRSLGVVVRAVPGAELEAEPPVVVPEPAPLVVEAPPLPVVVETVPKRRPQREPELAPEEPPRPVRRRERIVERPRMPSAPDVSWDAEDFAGEFAERRIDGASSTTSGNRDEAA